MLRVMLPPPRRRLIP